MDQAIIARSTQSCSTSVLCDSRSVFAQGIPSHSRRKSGVLYRRFYKPLQSDERGTNEAAFYTSFSSTTRIPDHIRKFFPVFHGTQLLQASDGSGLLPHLVLQDVVSNRLNPSIMDLKIGAMTWPPQASEDYIAKCLKKDRETTSVSLGFRITGFQMYGSKESGFWKPHKKLVQGFSTDDVKLVLRKFASSNASGDPDLDPDCAFASVVYGGSNGILAQLLELKAWFEDQTIFHFYSCSVLLIYEKELALKGSSTGAEIKLVDFAHVVEDNVRLVLRKFVSSNASGDSDPDCALASVVYGGSNGILAQLLELKAWLPLLFLFSPLIYEELALNRSSAGAEIKLVDFAHVVEGGAAAVKAYRVKLMLKKPIHLAGQVMKAADEARIFRSHCKDLKEVTITLAASLHQAARIGKDLHERPTLVVIEDTNQVLKRALTLVQKCSPNWLVKHVFSPKIHPDTFQTISSQLKNADDNLSWLLCISAAILDGSNGNYLCHPPPLAAKEPVLCSIWEKVAILSSRSLSHRLDAPKSLVLLAKKNSCYGKLIQEGICSVFAKVLKEGPMQLQAEVARAISELVANYAPFQQHFAQYNVILLLVSHLAFETMEEHSSCSKGKSPVLDLDVVEDDDPQSSSRPSVCAKGREYGEPKTKAYRKTMAAKALWLLAKGNSAICKSTTESKGLLCFAVLLEKGSKEVQRYSAMALMEITAVAEKDPPLRRSAFNPKSRTCEAVVDQLVRTIGKEDSELVVPCLKAIGNLARIFHASETRVIRPLVQLLGERAEFSREACIALAKFACPENYLHVEHSKAIIAAGGANRLIRLTYFGEQIVQSPAIFLLCHIVMHVPDSKELAEANVLSVLEWASTRTHVFGGGAAKLLLKAKSALVLYQSRGPRGFP
ncbi:hypothetical protein Vadar_023312 [Vaccinium darrowii]|uniref:Uncharacterized protein n=1 Tax=Vaccinium darrowii TaxID=229202 RepID=A0ACB7YY14_9ERIC|nr:hypothetical protein Vadar_023312 [Vaccinium darrowii]